ncbi:unnamed protein product [Calypogeia fissa]
MEDHREAHKSIVVGVIENRAREVGLAALDLGTASLHLSQFIETSRSYQNTTTLLQFFDPSVIVLSAERAVPEGMVPGLYNVVEYCIDAQKVPLARSCFDDHKGMQVLNKLAAMDANAISSKNYQKQYYLCIGAAAAVLSWTEHQTGHVITKNSLKVIFNGSVGHMSIDATSIMNLEVIRPNSQEDLQQRRKAKQKSLYCMLNTTKTVGGARLLRANLLQPLKTLGTINSRLDCLDDLTSNEQLLDGLFDILQKFPKDTDKLLCNFCVKRPKIVDDPTGVASTRRSQSLVAGIILLRETLELLPLLLKILQHAKCSLLCNINESLGSHSGYVQLRQKIAEVVAADVQSGRSSFIAKTNQFSAVKSGVDGFLDVARTTFNNTSDAIHKLCSNYREELQLPKLRLLYSNRHGFYLSLPVHNLQNGPLPSVFIKMVKRGNTVHFSSDELNSLNSRNQEAAGECYTRTERCLEDLTNHVRKTMHLLSLLSESLSLLDMMVNSFANFLSTKEPNAYARPEFSENGPLVIEAGRHPVLEGTSSKEFVPNNTFLAEVSNVMLVSGPNMSGKSTYLRQVALITILAHIGCYVPANFASFRIVDHLFTRLGTGDNLELNSSTFMTEMRETAFLMQYLSRRSLVLIDELGRATSTSDGFAISWSCCEFLLSSKAYVIFATHMQQLTELSNLYPDAQSCFFSVAITSSHRVDFKYVLKNGSTDVAHYGLLLSEIAGLPRHVVSNARKVTEEFLRKKNGTLHARNDEKLNPLLEKYRTARRLICLQYSQQERKTLLNGLKALKDRHSKSTL